MTRAQFERLVRETFNRLPQPILDSLENVDVVVEDWPTNDQLIGSGLDESELLLGLYEGIPLTERYGSDMVLPDKITLFQRAIESICATDEEVMREIRDTITHEVAHHFGYDDDALHSMGI